MQRKGCNLFGNMFIREEGLKMYNHTCDIADELGMGDNWKRKCPAGVKSCFWAEGRYNKQSKLTHLSFYK